MTLSSLPPRLRHLGVLALLSLAGMLLLLALPACTSSPAPTYTGVNRVGTPLPGDPAHRTRLATGSLEFAGPAAQPVAEPGSDPASAFSRSSVGPRPGAGPASSSTASSSAGASSSTAPSTAGRRFKNRVGEPIPGLDDLPPITALTDAGPRLSTFAAMGAEIGLSARGTPIHAIEFGGTGSTGATGDWRAARSPRPAPMGPPDANRVYLIGLIHGDEDEGYTAISDVLATLKALAGPGLSVRVVPTMNPDGQTAGRRGNANGVDLNRNWPASNFSPDRTRGDSPADQPEVAAVMRDQRTFAPDLLIVFHSIGNDGPFVNFDGPAKARDLAEAFAQAASIAGGGNWGVKASMGYETPGSLGTWAGVDRKIPTLTIEFRTGQRPAEVGRAATAGVRAAVGELSP